MDRTDKEAEGGQEKFLGLGRRRRHLKKNLKRGKRLERVHLTKSKEGIEPFTAVRAAREDQHRKRRVSLSYRGGEKRKLPCCLGVPAQRTRGEEGSGGVEDEK